MFKRTKLTNLNRPKCESSEKETSSHYIPIAMALKKALSGVSCVFIIKLAKISLPIYIENFIYYMFLSFIKISTIK